MWSKYTPPMGFFTSIYSTSWRVLAAEIRRASAIRQAEVEERRYSRDCVKQLVYSRCQWHSLQVYCLLIHWNAYRYVSDINDITSLTFIRTFSQSPLFKWFILAHRGALSVCSAEMKLENFLLQTWPMARGVEDYHDSIRLCNVVVSIFLSSAQVALRKFQLRLWQDRIYYPTVALVNTLLLLSFSEQFHLLYTTILSLLLAAIVK